MSPRSVENRSNSISRFEDLIEAVRKLFVGTRNVLDQHNIKVLEQYFTIDDASNRVPATVIFKGPTGVGNDDPPDTIEVPLGGLFTESVLNLTELTIEFDCELREQRHLFESGEKPWVMILKDWQLKPPVGTDRVRIEYMVRGQTLEGAVYINGEIFRELH